MTEELAPSACGDHRGRCHHGVSAHSGGMSTAFTSCSFCSGEVNCVPANMHMWLTQVLVAVSTTWKAVYKVLADLCCYIYPSNVGNSVAPPCQQYLIRYSI